MSSRHCVCQQRVDVSTLLEALAYVSQELRAVSTDNAELRNALAAVSADNAELRNALAALTARVTEVERGARQ